MGLNVTEPGQAAADESLLAGAEGGWKCGDPFTMEDVCTRQSWDSACHEWTCDEGAEKPAESIKCCGAPVDFQSYVDSYGAGCRAFYTDINSCYSWASEHEAATQRTATEEIAAAADAPLPAANESLLGSAQRGSRRRLSDDDPCMEEDCTNSPMFQCCLFGCGCGQTEGCGTAPDCSPAGARPSSLLMGLNVTEPGQAAADESLLAGAEGGWKCGDPFTMEDVCTRQSWDSACHEWTCDEGAEKPAESIKCCGAPVDFQSYVDSYGAGCRAFYTDINSCYSWASEPTA